MRRKSLISLILIIITAILMGISINMLQRTKNDNYIHASELQDDPANFGKECCVVLKAPFYAGTAMYLSGSYPYEYSYYPVYDCSSKNPGIVYLAYNINDENSVNTIQEACNQLKKITYGKDNKNIKDTEGIVISGILSESQYAIPDEAAFMKEVENYVPNMLQEPGTKELIPEEASYQIRPLVFNVSEISPPERGSSSRAIPIILAIIATLCFLTSACLTVSSLKDRR